ncbi:Hpt domain-containing protein [Pedobacter metabolipauper]|uniref:HPt (Histidine-containing phosphotransfer) domain-containing protein n=1 Tax=Pedobacter metabolipauper TaxID=425513 RepID=A0A4R6SU91_9SPHI|nr:Hpt domain-containing protein [Pedobacter metabolipauper]TDQ08340.1 HPt (histidine-containing phosphotransfer) domain-containing protein [Pedobacter metabolipauper]
MMINVQKNSEPLDLSYLRDMSGDSAEFIIEMIDLFKSQTPIYMEELKLALAEKDWAKVGACAHKIKPTFTYVGREDAKELMQLIENNARERTDLESLPAACEMIFAFSEVLYKQLDQAKSELQKQL